MALGVGSGNSGAGPASGHAEQVSLTLGHALQLPVSVTASQVPLTVGQVLLTAGQVPVTVCQISPAAGHAVQVRATVALGISVGAVEEVRPAARDTEQVGSTICHAVLAREVKNDIFQRRVGPQTLTQAGSIPGTV